jgi:hypothetical protein
MASAAKAGLEVGWMARLKPCPDVAAPRRCCSVTVEAALGSTNVKIWVKSSDSRSRSRPAECAGLLRDDRCCLRVEGMASAAKVGLEVGWMARLKPCPETMTGANREIHSRKTRGMQKRLACPGRRGASLADTN